MSQYVKPEDVAIIKDVIVALAAIITSSVAIHGINKWLRELRGRSEFETAQNVLRATYKLRVAIKNYRSAHTFAYEYPSNYNNTSENSGREEAKAQQYVFANRWEPVGIARTKFDDAVIDAEVLWGDKIKQLADQIYKCLSDLAFASNMIIDDLMANEAYSENSHEFMVKMRRTVYTTNDEIDNDLTNQLTLAINNIEVEMRTHLQEPHRKSVRGIFRRVNGSRDKNKTKKS